MNFKTLSYFALVDKHKASGVIKKIEGTVKTFEDLGFEANCLIKSTSLKGVLEFFKELFFCRSQILIVRFSDLVFPLVFFALIFLRLSGKKIIIDIPTPRTIGINEIWYSSSNVVIKLVRILLNYLSAAWVLFPANLIVQYAEESTWFNFGVKKRTLKLGNGIVIKKTEPANRWYREKPITLVIVAQLADWHGYDRLLRALASMEGGKNEFEVKIIGDGDALADLVQLAGSLELSNVDFLGRKVGAELSQILKQCNVGISSLGLYRKGLMESSDLKTREYIAAGLPVIGVGTDPDFTFQCDYRFIVENSNEIDSLISCLEALPDKLEKLVPEEVAQFAVTNLSMSVKVLQMIKRLE